MLDIVRSSVFEKEREIQFLLNRLNTLRLNPALPSAHWKDEISEMTRLAIIEGMFLEHRRQAIAERAALAPAHPDDFLAWFEELKEIGPGQHDPLFPWLAEQCSMDQMRWFLTQEVAGEAGFEDLTALTQLKLPTQAKLELARNYWDEMGRGNPKAMHGPLLCALAEHLDLNPLPETTVTQSLALANTMAGLAANRRYAYHSVGALGVIEMTAPARSAATSAGLKRLGVRAGHRHYFALHAVLDIKHSMAWNTEAIKPLVFGKPEIATAIAEGALMRLECGARCFERYRTELGLG
jgi:Iron-containing redox enzyme